MPSLQQCFLCWKLICFVIIHVTWTEGIEHGIAQTGRCRQLFCEREFVTDIGCAFQCLLTLQLVALDVGCIAHRLILSCLHIIMLHGQSVGKGLLFRQAMTDVKLAPQLVDAETQSCGHRGRCPVLVEIIVVVDSGRQRGRNLLIQHRTPLC